MVGNQTVMEAMNERPLILCCWPGLAQLWIRGTWSALFLAVGSAVLLNLALVSTFVWPTLFGTSFTWVAWPILMVVWLASGWLSYCWLGEQQDRPAIPEVANDTLFNQAQHEYLKGEWSQAEELLKRRLTKKTRDVEARLLLIAIMRRTERWEQVEQQLEQLEKLDAARAWSEEIRRERQMIPEDWAAESDIDSESADKDGEIHSISNDTEPEETINLNPEVDGKNDSAWPKAA